MPTFADIEAEIDNVLSAISPDMTEDEQAAFDDYLSELAQQESGKADNLGFILKGMAERAENLKDLSRQITAKAKAVENATARLKGYYLMNMEAAGLEKIKGDVFTISRRFSTAVEVTNVDKLPDEYVRITVSKDADKKAIMAALKSGVLIDGAELRQNVSLQVR